MNAESDERPPVECGVCGRKLHTPESKRRGRGRVCDEKVSPRRGRDHSPPAAATGRRPAVQGGPSLLDELGPDQ